MLLLQTLPINKELHALPTEQLSGPSPSSSSRVTTDDRAGVLRRTGDPVPGYSHSQAASAADYRGPNVTSRPDAAGAPTDDASDDGTAASGSAGRRPSERPASTAVHPRETSPNVPEAGSRMVRLSLSDLPASGSQSEGGSVSTATQTQSSQSPQSTQSSQSSEVAQLTSVRSSDPSRQGEPVAETSRQRYDKLFRYFQTLDSERCSSAADRSCSTEGSEGGSKASSRGPSLSPISPILRPNGSSCESSDGSTGFGGGQSSASSASSPTSPGSSASEAPLRSIGYAGFVGVPQPSSGGSEGYAGYPVSAEFACLRDSSPARSRRNRAPRAIRGAGQSRQTQPGSSGPRQTDVARGVAQASILQRPAQVQAPVLAPAPASVTTARYSDSRPGPQFGRQSSVPPPRLWRVPTPEERFYRPAPPPQFTDPLSFAWYSDFDDLMAPCRGDRPLPPRAGRLRHRQPAPSQQTLRQLRERVCLGCSRAFPESNYFDVYCHVNTVYRWFNWRLDC